MIFTIDIGNSNINIDAVDNGSSMFHCRISSSRYRTGDEYAVLMKNIAEQHGFNLKEVSGVIISSVVPQLTSVLKYAVKLCTGCDALVMAPGVKTGLNIRIDDPGEMGSDIVAAAVGAITRYPLPCVIIHIATATSIGVIDKNGCYIGGLICPGHILGQVALEKGASRLPSVSLEPPKKVIGRSTGECLRSGIVYGAAAMLDGLIERISDELGESPTVVATGETGADIVHNCRSEIIFDSELKMRGLINIYEKNKRS
ncbi:MAG: type III pantothenate kinase [Oscillospiraceae bacterium]|nr:type III pantothenate kinase [Oscillospiraceae bacterium]